MSSGLLPDHIEPLVNRLRAGDHLPIALPDVAAVTEILMRSLESYFKSIDLTLYKECQELADYIEDARAEISSLSPDHDDSAGIPRAGQELDAIVEATESATNAIMQSAEDLMNFETDDFEQYKEHINAEVLKIFEACSFQDITGQRISKVVRTLNDVEDRVGKLITILGINNNAAAAANPIFNSEDITMDDEDLLHGPALAGEGIDQGEVDSLLDDEPALEDVPVAEVSENLTDIDMLLEDEPAVEDMPEEEASEEVANIELLLEDEPALEDVADLDSSAENEAVVFEALEEEQSESPEAIDVETSTEIDFEDNITSEAQISQDNIAQDISEAIDIQQATSENDTEENDVDKTSQKDIDSLFG